MHPVDIAVEELAEVQAGRFNRAQVRDLAGGSRSLIQSRLRSGRWKRLTSRVLRLPGAPSGRVPDAWTAHLHVGADSVVGRETAAGLLGVPSIAPTKPVLLVPDPSHRRCSEARIHQVGDLFEHHRTTIDGLPVTTLERTLVDLSIAGCSVARMDAWLDHLAGERRLRPDDLRRVVDDLRRPGKRRPMSLLVALSRRAPGSGVEQSRLERALTEVVRLAGLGDGMVQHPHPGRPESWEVVDRAFPEAMLVIEADGRTWHAREAAFVTDRRRDREAAVAGWQTLRYVFDDLTRAQPQVAQELAAVHHRRIELLSPVTRADCSTDRQSESVSPGAP